MAAYYNDNDPFVCQWLGNLIHNGLIAPGTIDPRSIKDVTPDDLRGYTRCHFFAGIGGWDLALQLAGWPDDAPVWTGSCPCQPYSEAGKRLGDEDPRNLWPELFRLVRQCRPPTVFGEQVDAAIRHGWLDRVFGDLEGEGYACGAAVLGAHSVGAPHIRQRLYWVAHAPGERLHGGRENAPGVASGVPGAGLEPDWSEYHRHRINVEPGAFPLVAGVPAELGLGEPKLRRMVRRARLNRRGRFRGYGNSIVPQLAAVFVRAAVEACNDIVGGGAVMTVTFENEPRKPGIMTDLGGAVPAVPVVRLSDGSDGEPALSGSEPDANAEAARAEDGDPPHKDESFTRETLPGAVGDISGWDDQALRTGMGAECAALRTLDVPYPGRYHRLGTFIIESVKRFGDEDVKQLLRQEGIDSTRAWRAEQIATLYTFDQAAAFPSLRAILGTLPSKQPRKPKPQAGLTSDGGHQTAAPQEPLQVPAPAANDKNILDRFIQLGIEVRELLGDEALDNAVERIKTYAPQTFEQAFVEV